jgi:hypothetical protein
MNYSEVYLSAQLDQREEPYGAQLLRWAEKPKRPQMNTQLVVSVAEKVDQMSIQN